MHQWARVNPISEISREESVPLPTRLEGPKPYLGFKRVSLAFGSNQVLDDVSFGVSPGETVCVLGRSGVGKSVCLRILMGFLKPDSGRVIAAGEDITDYSEEELQRIRKKVTLVFQNGALFDSLTVGENVAFPLRERGDFTEEEIYQRVDGLLELLRIRPLRDSLPSDLSTGMKRSVAIARALAAQPQGILYDEPTTMVDPPTELFLTDLIRNLKIRLHLTSVVVSHDLRLVEKIADHVVFLDRAKVVFRGTVAEMERSVEPVVQQFLKLDRITLQAMEVLAAAAGTPIARAS